MNDKSRWFGLLFISIGVSLIIVDTTIVNVAIPAIVADIALTSTEVQWVQTAYTLVFAALLIPFGAVADRIGRRTLMVIGVIIFTLASVAAGLAPNGGFLVFARVLQGFGGAMVLPTTVSLINATFRGKERGIAFAIWGGTIGGMAAVGPLLGGWLATDFSWRWAFGVNVPFGILVVIGVLRTVANSRSGEKEGFDLVGAALAALATGTLVFGLIDGRTLGWWTSTEHVADWWTLELSPVPFLFLAALILGILLVVWSGYRSRRGKASLLPLDLFAVRSFSAGNIVAMIVSLGELGMLFVLPLWMQNVLGYDPLQAGFMLLSLAIGSFLASGAGSGLSRSMTPLGMLRLGVALEFAALLALAIFLSQDSGWFLLAAILFVYGLGLGLASAQVTNVVLAEIPVEQSGRGSGMQSASRQVGSALGVAALGTVLFSSLGDRLNSSLEGLLPDEQREGLVNAVTESAGGMIPKLLSDPNTQEIGQKAAEAFTGAASTASYVAAAFLLVALLASSVLRARRLEDMDKVKTEPVKAE